ncbi:MAG: hypothetical protein ACRDKZ_13245 [Actinomycetota bacterium]
MNRRTRWIAGGTIAVAVIGGGTGIAATSGDDSEAPITGDALEKASDAALDHTGGGRVTDTEVGDEEGYYEVEVTREGGGQVDVHLDSDFNILSTEDDGAGDEEGPDDD